MMDASLNGVTVLDMADRAPIAGHMLAKLGARVIQLEPLQGTALRETEPWVWAAYGAGKASATIDLASERGRAAFRLAIAAADILIESEDPGRLDALGLGREELNGINPRLIHVSVTPFGSSGPKAAWQASDLVLWAAGGPLFPNRDADLPPLGLSIPQSWRHAGADAAAAALLALRARDTGAPGQHVDISVQQSVSQATLAATLADGLGHRGFNFGVPQPDDDNFVEPTLDLSGSGSRTRRSKWSCADGLVEMHLGIGSASGAKSNHLFAWMEEEDALPERFRSWNWVALPAAFERGELDMSDLEAARAAVTDFLVTKSKADIVNEAVRRGILMAPVYTIEDLVESPHHKARGLFQPAGPNGAAIPGPFALGLAVTELTPAPPIGAPLDICPEVRKPAEPAAGPGAALEGLRVVDLAWVVAGPAIGRALADYGAEVVRVESRKRVDTARLMGPFPSGVLDVDRSACFEAYNSGKLGVSLDLATKEGRAVVRDLVARADVLVESFAPGQMARWNLSYDDMRAINPRLVMVSTSLMGQTGPYARVAGFGNVGAAMAGYQPLVGWPGRLPLGPFGPYTDYVGPRFGLTALLAALRQRDATGEGAWLDVSQAEAGIQFLAPEIAEFGATGRLPSAEGNRSCDMAPHGVFPAAGFDRWVAITVRSDEEWTRLAAMIGGDASSPRFATFEGRKTCEAEVEALVASWSAGLSAEECEAQLQGAKIAAHLAANGADMLRDPQLLARGHFVRLPRGDGTESLVESSRFRLSATPAAYRVTAPSFGRDNAKVLGSLLGYAPDRIERLKASGALV